MKHRVSLRQYPLVNIPILNSIKHTTIMIDGVGEFSFSITGLDIGKLNLGDICSNPVNLGETDCSGDIAIELAKQFCNARPYNIVDNNCNTFCGYMANVLGVRQPPLEILNQYKNKQQQFNLITTNIAKFSSSLISNIYQTNKDVGRRYSQSPSDRRL